MTHTFIINSDFDGVNLARAQFKNLFGDQAKFILALVEALNNIVIHSNAKSIELKVEISEEEIVITISSYSQEFDSSLPVDRPEMEPMPKGGFGLYLMQTIADRVKHRYIKGKNILTLRKFIIAEGSKTEINCVKNGSTNGN